MRDTNPPAGSAGSVLIQGVVHGLGAGGGQIPPATTWTLSFSLAVWRDESGTLHSTEVRIERPGILHAELETLMDRVRPYAIVEMRVRFTEPGRAELIDLISNELKDDALLAHATELQKPLEMIHPLLGVLTLDRRFNTWEGRMSWCGTEVALALEAAEGPELTQAMETALALRKDQESWGKRIGECAIGGLLALKNDAWRDDDEPEITASEFLERIRVRTISVTPQGEFVFWHDDDDLFWGHAIQVSGTLIDGPTDASIAG